MRVYYPDPPEHLVEISTCPITGEVRQKVHPNVTSASDFCEAYPWVFSIWDHGESPVDSAGRAVHEYWVHAKRHRLQHDRGVDVKADASYVRQQAHTGAVNLLEADLLGRFDRYLESGESSNVALYRVVRYAGETFAGLSAHDYKRVNRPLINSLVGRVNDFLIVERAAKETKSRFGRVGASGYQSRTGGVRAYLEEHGGKIRGQIRKDPEARDLKEEWARERVREVVDVLFRFEEGEVVSRLRAIKAASGFMNTKKHPGMGQDGLPSIFFIIPQTEFVQLSGPDGKMIVHEWLDPVYRVADPVLTTGKRSSGSGGPGPVSAGRPPNKPALGSRRPVKASPHGLPLPSELRSSSKPAVRTTTPHPVPLNLRVPRRRPKGEHAAAGRSVPSSAPAPAPPPGAASAGATTARQVETPLSFRVPGRRRSH